LAPQAAALLRPPASTGPLQPLAAAALPRSPACCGSDTVATRCASAVAGSGAVVVTIGRRRSPPSPCSRPAATPSTSAAWWGRPYPSSAPWQAQEGAQWAPPWEHEDKKLRPWPI
jgi:hypothetical protein